MYFSTYKRKRENKMEYKRYNISETNLEKGMIVNGKINSIKPYGAFVKLENGVSRTFVY